MTKSNNNSMAPWELGLKVLAQRPRCGAKNRQGTPCQQPAMKNGRCRFHGGLSTGPPKGSQNALKHGFYTREAIETRRRVRELLRQSKALLNSLN